MVSSSTRDRFLVSSQKRIQALGVCWEISLKTSESTHSRVEYSPSLQQGAFLCKGRLVFTKWDQVSEGMVEFSESLGLLHPHARLGSFLLYFILTGTVIAIAPHEVGQNHSANVKVMGYNVFWGEFCSFSSILEPAGFGRLLFPLHTSEDSLHGMCRM